MVHTFTMLLTYIHSVNVQYYKFVIDRQILTNQENENVKSRQAEIV